MTATCPAHLPRRHRDGRPPWCCECGLTRDGKHWSTWPREGGVPCDDCGGDGYWEVRDACHACAHEARRAVNCAGCCGTGLRCEHVEQPPASAPSEAAP